MLGNALYQSLSTLNGVHAHTLLNAIKKVDWWFIGIVGALIVLAVAFYFLIPVFRRKQYREARENLQKREAAFRASTGRSHLEQDGEPERKDETGNGPDGEA